MACALPEGPSLLSELREGPVPVAGPLAGSEEEQRALGLAARIVRLQVGLEGTASRAGAAREGWP